MSDRAAVFVHLLPRLIPAEALKGSVAVVIDVLRASTVIVHALAAGCEAIIPCLEVDDARRMAASLPAGTALLGGERGGEPVPGFDLANSPATYTPEICQGKTLVLTTTNGTRAILASLDADRVLVAAFVNRQATLDALAVEPLKLHGRTIHIVCSGTEGYISLEDTLLAGALAASLKTEWSVVLGNDEAHIATALWHNTVHGEPPRLVEISAIHDVIKGGRGGGNVHRLGLDHDIVDVAQVDRFDFAAELFRDPLRIVASRGSTKG
jgi:2-phosphosulfolactate phosphatase